jgi:hypothetical protein
MTIQAPTARRVRHDPGIGIAGARCPLCDQPITPEQLIQIQGKERAREAKIKEVLEARFTRERQQVEARTTALIAQAKRDATKTAEQQIRRLKAGQDAMIAARLKTQRDAAEKKLTEALAAERTKAYAERMTLDAQLADLQRKLQRKTANELGEPAEVDLFEALKAAFPGDRVRRVSRGQRGPDVVVEVIERGSLVGKIVVDAKNHRKWMHSFTRKLRGDQLAEGADFAILSSSVFPAGAQQLHIQDHVIVANPARVIVLMHLLRRQLIQNNVFKLSTEARNEKADKLYSFITSRAGGDLLGRIVKLTEEMTDLDRTETAAHQKVWTKRSDLIRAVQDIHDEFSAAVSRIISGSEASA